MSIRYDLILTWLKKQHKRFSIRETFVFMCFVGFAGMMWYAHAMGSVRSAKVPIQITYTGVPKDIILSDSLQTKIYIEVRDAGRRLKTYFVNPLSLSFNVSDQINGENGTITISADIMHRSVNAILQGTTKLQTISPEILRGSYYRQNNKRVPIKLESELQMASQYQLVRKPKLGEDSVTIYGAKEQLKKVRCISTQNLVISEIRDTMIVVASLEAPKGIRLSQEQVSVHIIAEQFTEKTFTKTIETCRVPQGMHLRLFPTEVQVSVHVGLSHFSEVDENNVEVRCDYPTGDSDKLPVYVVCQHPHITYTRCTPSVVEFLIEKQEK